MKKVLLFLLVLFTFNGCMKKRVPIQGKKIVYFEFYKGYKNSKVKSKYMYRNKNDSVKIFSPLNAMVIPSNP